MLRQVLGNVQEALITGECLWSTYCMHVWSRGRACCPGIYCIWPVPLSSSQRSGNSSCRWVRPREHALVWMSHTSQSPLQTLSPPTPHIKCFPLEGP